eukprot:tig00021179_g19271.t1
MFRHSDSAFRRVPFDISYATTGGYGLDSITHSLAGGLLSFLLVGRYSSATDRWWNVKTSLNGVAGGIESFVSILYSYAAGKRENFRANRQLARLLYGFYTVGVRTLGGSDASTLHDLPLVLSTSELNAIRKYEGGKPNMLHAIARRELFSRTPLDWFARKEADKVLEGIMGNMAKISEYSTTRIPLPAVQMLNVALTVYFATLPLVLMPTFKATWGLHVMVPTAMGALAFMFYGVKNAAEEMEYPFGSDDNDVNTFAASRALHNGLRAVISLHEGGSIPLGEAPTFWLDLCEVADRDVSAQTFVPGTSGPSPYTKLV